MSIINQSIRSMELVQASPKNFNVIDASKGMDKSKKPLSQAALVACVDQMKALAKSFSEGVEIIELPANKFGEVQFISKSFKGEATTEDGSQTYVTFNISPAKATVFDDNVTKFEAQEASYSLKRSGAGSADSGEIPLGHVSVDIWQHAGDSNAPYDLYVDCSAN
jgi:hypothetical protein